MTKKEAYETAMRYANSQYKTFTIIDTLAQWITQMICDNVESDVIDSDPAVVLMVARIVNNVNPHAGDRLIIAYNKVLGYMKGYEDAEKNNVG